MNDLEFIRSKWEWDQDYALAQAVRSGDYLWLSGQIGYDKAGTLVGPGDLQAQARQLFTNMREILELSGSSLQQVVRLTNYFAVPVMDFQLAQQYWEVKREFFGDRQPASTGIQVSGLINPDLMLEVDAIAYAPRSGNS